jgi:hypothetical protein
MKRAFRGSKFDLRAGRDEIGNRFRVASGAQPATTLALAGAVFKYSTDSAREPPKIYSLPRLPASSGQAKLHIEGKRSRALSNSAESESTEICFTAFSDANYPFENALGKRTTEISYSSRGQFIRLRCVAAAAAALSAFCAKIICPHIRTRSFAIAAPVPAGMRRPTITFSSAFLTTAVDRRLGHSGSP